MERVVDEKAAKRRLERVWAERSRDGVMLCYQMPLALSSLRKNIVVDEDELENLIAECDKQENGTLSFDDYSKICEHFLNKK